MIGLTMHRLRDLHSGACETDARVLVEEGNQRNVSIRTMYGTSLLRISGTRELRLLAKQLEWFADYFDCDSSLDLEEIIP